MNPESKITELELNPFRDFKLLNRKGDYRNRGGLDIDYFLVQISDGAFGEALNGHVQMSAGISLGSNPNHEEVHRFRREMEKAADYLWDKNIRIVKSNKHEFYFMVGDLKGLIELRRKGITEDMPLAIRLMDSPQVHILKDLEKKLSGEQRGI
jgi:hypothetical protein